ncbi:Spy/CpxP family protein refolding chaperone [Microvirga sp. Mcv34]|uniref:Spy/CpxP family protein refolding chaperone n=1 Tax=Microvirga sp. Mcv34 TaxID=2926016 RepID=UPI0021C6EE6B|nr:Spy/CpxP family protein refolding chaperone [Microvirga sp. Mcv34]
MSDKFLGTSMLAVATAAGILLTGLGATAADQPVHLAMHDMMPMQSQNSGSMSGGMMDDDKMGMQQPNQPGQMGGMSGAGSMPSQSQSGSAGGMQSPSGSMGGGMRDDDKMRMPQQQGQSGQMGSGMQSQGSMGSGGSMAQGSSSGQMGGMMSDNMMRMMNDHMRMMNDQMRMRSGMPGMAPGPSMVDMTDRIEGRLAFLRAELRITDGQASAWNSFADGLRSSRQHLMEARQQLSQTSSKPTDRLEQYEHHLMERLEALKTARAAFTQLYATLDEAQKRTADELVVPFIATF